MNGKCLRIGGEPFDGTTHIALTDFLKEMGYYQLESPVDDIIIIVKIKRFGMINYLHYSALKDFSIFIRRN